MADGNRTRGEVVADVLEVFPGAVILDAPRGWEDDLRAAWRAGFRMKLGAGNTLHLTPGACRWPQRWLGLVVAHQDELRERLQRVREAPQDRVGGTIGG